uniref:Uncharacterized protein n=1 Tax=Rhizophora mucronata TaxID=61149 RepID=A0A2P2KSL2_RHIMU
MCDKSNTFSLSSARNKPHRRKQTLLAILFLKKRKPATCSFCCIFK